MAEEIQAQLARLFPALRRRYTRCLKKVGYPTSAAAETARQRRQAYTDVVLRVYGACQDCGLWHLTHAVMPASRVQAELAILEAETAQMHQQQQTLRAAVRPYTKHHAMYRKPPHAIIADRQEHFTMLRRLQDLIMAVRQRGRALDCATAATTQELKALERHHDALVSTQQTIFDEDWRRGIKIYDDVLTYVVDDITMFFGLPCYEWRQYLTPVTRGRSTWPG